MDYIDISDLNKIEDITTVIYINLDSRTDRKKHVEEQLKSVGLTHFERFKAIKLADGNGALGCSMSHLKCLQLAKERKLEHVLICEDDITFLNPPLFMSQLNKFLSTNKEWDVLLIGGNNIPPVKYVDDTCVQVTYFQTTTGYLVRSQYFDKLIDNFKTGITYLMRNPTNTLDYGIDRYWLRLQQVDTWLLLIPLTVTQRADYSDIEHKQTDYTKAMTSLNKEYLKK